MKAVAGVFRSQEAAYRAAGKLFESGMARERVSVLTPGGPRRVESVATTEAEQPGIGQALGGLVGGVVGVAGGLDLGAAAAAVLVPGVGPVLATGLFGAALLGAAGAVAGAEVGDALEEALSEGLPKDELYIYQDALRKGRSVVIALAEGDERADHIRRVFSETGAESLDPARKDAWVGLRDADEEKYGT